MFYKRKCKIEGCNNLEKVRIHQLCKAHYSKLQKYGDPTVSKIRTFTCSVENCDRLARTDSDLCDMHHKRKLRNGDPEKLTRQKAKGVQCNWKDCTAEVYYNGMCSSHLRLSKLNRDYFLIESNKGLQCKASNCNNEAKIKGYCDRHYNSTKVYNRDFLIKREYGTGSIVNGYKYITVDGEQIAEHIYLAQKALGKKLPKDAVVHHMNGNGTDNYIRLNLVICPDRAYHNLLHARMRAILNEPLENLDL